MAAQVVTVIGVLLGSVTTFSGTWWIERSRFRRSLETRWDAKRLEVYADFMSCVKDEVRAANRHVQAERRGGDVVAARAELEGFETRRSGLYERVVLLGAPTVIAAADQVNQRVFDLLRAATHPALAGNLQQAGDDVIAALNHLHGAAREELGISGLQVPARQHARPDLRERK